MSRSWTEPKSAANDENKPLYPYNDVTITESGHSWELDDTPERERIRLQHRTGTFFEMHPNSDYVHKVKGNNFTIIVKDNNVKIKGDCNVLIEGDCSMQVKGDYTLQVDGDYTQKVSGSFNQLNANESSKDDRVTEGDLHLSATKNIILSAQKVIVNGETSINGNLGCGQTITAFGNINSYANVFGLLSLRTPGALLVGPSSAILPTIPAAGTALIDLNLIVGVNAMVGVNLSVGGIAEIGGSTTIGGLLTVGGIIEAPDAFFLMMGTFISQHDH